MSAEQELLDIISTQIREYIEDFTLSYNNIPQKEILPYIVTQYIQNFFYRSDGDKENFINGLNRDLKVVSFKGTSRKDGLFRTIFSYALIQEYFVESSLLQPCLHLIEAYADSKVSKYMASTEFCSVRIFEDCRSHIKYYLNHLGGKALRQRCRTIVTGSQQLQSQQVFKGNKAGLFQEAPLDPDRPRTANLTKMGTMLRRDKTTEKPWVQKLLSSTQEVIVECITGELYRYLIGGEQPKIRTANQTTILSEVVAFTSLRDFFNKEKIKALRPTIVQTFNQHIDGFMRVLFSSILMEENDLSDANFGLSYKGKLPEATYQDFVKIDHGQSLNTLRIAKSKNPVLGLAPIKYFPPPSKDTPKDEYDIDTRIYDKDDKTRNYRKTCLRLFQKRHYNIDPYFITWGVFDFLMGRIDLQYIKGMNEYQPSALPLYDGRLLTFFSKIKDKYDLFELGKFAIMAKIIFTSDDVVRGIGNRAAHTELHDVQDKVIARILQNKETFQSVAATSPDFCVYCYEEKEAITAEIKASLYRMTHKKSEGKQDVLSERYKDIAGIRPIDVDELKKICHAGERLKTNKTVISRLIDEIEILVLTGDWGAKGKNNITSWIDKKNKVLPETALKMAQAIHIKNLSPKTRLCDAMEMLTDLAKLAAGETGGSSKTRELYRQILSAIEKHKADSPPIKLMLESYDPDDPAWIDYRKLATGK